MFDWAIRWSLRNRLTVVLLYLILAGASIVAALNMAVASAQSAWPDAIMVCLHPGWVQTAMGGDGAPVTVQDSAAGLRRVMAGLTAADRGAFIQYDGQRFDTW